MSLLSKTKSKSRGPHPSLFLHPSPGDSHVSLPGILASGAGGTSVPVHPSVTLQRNETNGDNDSNYGGAQSFDARPGRSLLKVESSRTTDRTDALWAKMQATLEDVELSATGGTHVFGPEHDRKLAELRSAQIALARAWARSEADDANESQSLDLPLTAGGNELRMRTARHADTSNGIPGTSAVPNSAQAMGGATARDHPERLGQNIAGDTEVDIAMARKRREANDQYFEKVNSGVLDVVAKLEEVAQAMRAVERETKDVWDENRSI